MPQLQLDLYLIKCSHREVLTTETCGWCEECDAWIDGVEVGDIQVFWEDSGRILVEGGGYAPHEANMSH